MLAAIDKQSFMQRIIQFFTSVMSLTLISCNQLKETSVDSIAELYSGSISIAKGTQASTSKGKEDFFKLTMEENQYLSSGWLIPEAMANNCAMIFAKANPQTFNDIDLLQIEIANYNNNVFEYRKQEVSGMDTAYKKIAQTIEDFINLLESNKIEEATQFMKTNTNTNLNDVSSFLKSIKSILPAKRKSFKIIGYKEDIQFAKIFEIDFVVISQDDVRRMIKATMEEDINGFKFRNITI